MSNVVLKNASGTQQTYSGVKTVRLRKTDDSYASFTEGVAESKTISALDFSNGNETFTPDSGKLWDSVTVNKPATLLPENIKYGVTIAGIPGASHEGNLLRAATAASLSSGSYSSIADATAAIESATRITVTVPAGKSVNGIYTHVFASPIYLATTGASPINPVNGIVDNDDIVVARTDETDNQDGTKTVSAYVTTGKYNAYAQVLSAFSTGEAWTCVGITLDVTYE